MAFYDSTRTHATGSLSGAIATLISEVRTWRDGILTRRALAKLTDRELSDIGLLRSDLDTMPRSPGSRF
ncbi:MAG: DUF1127 domain-containing protein [Pseudomonadota bacterium]